MDKEQEFINAIKEAEELGSALIAMGSTSTRENAIAFTNLQTARLWAEADCKAKADKIARASR
jgi:hypothetical protein